MKKLIIAFVFSTVLFVGKSFSQCDTIANSCVSRNMTKDFISDGQQYRALLVGDDVAEFKATFYGGSTYRISACSGFSDGNLAFSLYDSDKNLLYSSKDYNYAPYWDFKMNSTVDGFITAELNEITSGCAVLLISFKQN